MKKIYIAGKINGLDDYRKLFKEAEDNFIEDGYVVMNPAVLGEGFDYEVYLPICLLMLQACDTVYMLNNYKDSKGAKVELEYAKAQGKKIIYQPKEMDYSIGYKHGKNGFSRETYITAKNIVEAVEKLKDEVGEENLIYDKPFIEEEYWIEEGENDD